MIVFLCLLWTAAVYVALSPMLILSWWLLMTSRMLTWGYRHLTSWLTGTEP